MATYGWMINLTGNAIPVYSERNGGPYGSQIGKITRNECFIEGSFSENPWEGDGSPVFFLNSNHDIKFGLLLKIIFDRRKRRFMEIYRR